MDNIFVFGGTVMAVLFMTSWQVHGMPMPTPASDMMTMEQIEVSGCGGHLLKLIINFLKGLLDLHYFYVSK